MTAAQWAWAETVSLRDSLPSLAALTLEARQARPGVWGECSRPRNKSWVDGLETQAGSGFHGVSAWPGVPSSPQARRQTLFQALL